MVKKCIRSLNTDEKSAGYLPQYLVTCQCKICKILLFWLYLLMLMYCFNKLVEMFYKTKY